MQPPLRENKESRNLILYLQNEKTIESMESIEVIKLIESIYKNIYDITNPKENPYFKEILKSFENRNYISKKHI